MPGLSGIPFHPLIDRLHCRSGVGSACRSNWLNAADSHLTPADPANRVVCLGTLRGPAVSPDWLPSGQYRDDEIIGTLPLTLQSPYRLALAYLRGSIAYSLSVITLIEYT